MLNCCLISISIIGQQIIYKINSNLDIAIRTTTGTAIKGEKFSLGARYYVRNRICFVSFETTPNVAVANGDIVLTDLPSPYCSNVYLGLHTTNGNCYSARIKSNGTLEIYFPSYTAASRIDTSFCYFTI